MLEIETPIEVQRFEAQKHSKTIGKPIFLAKHIQGSDSWTRMPILVPEKTRMVPKKHPSGSKNAQDGFFDHPTILVASAQIFPKYALVFFVSWATASIAGWL